ncbi:MAG: right-handed parallel beta-helix repeat-containing protein, partial [Bacteroidota bacterium]
MRPFSVLLGIALLATLMALTAPIAHGQTVRDSVRIDLVQVNTSGRTEAGNGFCSADAQGFWPNVLQDILGTPDRSFGYSDYTLVATEGQFVPTGRGQIGDLPDGLLGHDPQIGGGQFNFNPEGPIPDCAPQIRAVAFRLSGAWGFRNARPFRVTDWYAVFSISSGTPIALFEWEQTDGFTVEFDGFAADLSLSREVDATAPGGKRPVVAYAWDFGDGSTASGPAPRRTYDEAGTYEVTLTVTDDDGEENARTAMVTVEAARLAVTVEAMPSEANVGEEIDLVATVTNIGTAPVFDVEVGRVFAAVLQLPEAENLEGRQFGGQSIEPVALADGEPTEERRDRLDPGASVEVSRSYLVERSYGVREGFSGPYDPLEGVVNWKLNVVVGMDDEGEPVPVLDDCEEIGSCPDSTRILKTPLVVRPAIATPEVSRRDTLVVRATVENTGAVPLRDVFVPAAFTFEFAYADTIDVNSVTDPELSRASGQGNVTLEAVLEPGASEDVDIRYVVDRAASVEVEVAPGQTETVQVAAEVTASIEGVVGFTDDDNNLRIVARVEDPLSCPFDPGVTGGALRGRVAECAGTIEPGSNELIVNSTTSNNDEEPGDGVCSTGETVTVDGESVDECTFRAAWQEAASLSLSDLSRIDFNIPDVGDGEPHVLDLAGTALPEVRAALDVIGESQPDGTPIEVSGTGLDGEDGLVMRDGVVSSLAFYSFPGNVLTVGDGVSIIADNRFGTSWGDVTNPDLADALRNGGDALVVTGDDVEVRNNLIVGSRNGIRASGADSLVIIDNQIGDVNAPNTDLGILLENTSGSIVGGLDGTGNLVAFNQGGGVRIDGESPGVVVARNEIRDNGGDALWVRQPADLSVRTVIGGGEADQGNIITHNDGVGLRLLGPGVVADGPTAVSVQSNTIEDNGDYGIVLEGGSSVLIGGEVASNYGAAPGNLIASGIDLASGFNTRIQGNVISNLDERGVSTGDPALRVRGSRNTVGGDDALVGNAIVGTPDPSLGARGTGILDEGTETLIAHNVIGTDGTSAQGFENGLVLRTTTTLQTNVIAGNADAGVRVESGEVLIADNLIGTDDTGRTALPNGGAGIEVVEGSATIGGEKDGEACEDPCNVISGNGGPGILVRAEGSATIEGNVIGGALAGQRVLGNGGSGVEVHSDGVRVGGPSDIATLGTCSGVCNRIVGNGGDGVRTFEAERIVTPLNPQGVLVSGEEGASGVVIQGNLIGADLVAAGNQGNGVALGGGGQGNVVGGGEAGAGNRIVSNGGSGVVLHPTTSGNFFASETQGLIRENAIYGNAKAAIDLHADTRINEADGWSRLDAGDDDEGPNDLLNWPYLIESRADGFSSDLLVLWTGESGTYSVDLYANASCVSGSSAAIPVTTRSVTFDGDLGETVLLEDISTLSGDFLTATVRTTGADGITSEVSNCRRIGRRGTQANANVDPEVATAINDVIVTLRNDAPLQPGTPPATPLSARSGRSQTLLVVQVPEGESSAPFEEASAQAPSGATVTPRSTTGPQWELTTLAGKPIRAVDLCLRADGIGNDADRAVLVAASPATNGRWRPFDTRIETVDDVAYACADGVLPGGAYTLATADAPVLVAPTLLAPADGAADVARDATLSWSSVLGAERYDVQLDRDGTFETPDVDEADVEATALLVEGLEGLTTYAWRVRARDAAGVGPWSEPSTFSTTMGVGTEGEGPSEEPDEVVPSAFALGAYPNPARGRMTVEVALAEPSQ